jgi:hypothetical protein
VRLTGARWRAAVAVGALVLAGCSGNDDGDAAKATTTTTPKSTTSPATTTTTTPPMTYRSTTFGVPFTVDLPGGWTVAERDDAAAQLYVACASCVHDGEENGEITIGLDLQDVTPDEAARQLAATPRLRASAIEPWTAGTLTGLHFTGERPRDLGEVRFAGGYHTEADAEPIEVILLRVAGKTVMILVDTHKAKGDDALDFRSAATDVLATLRFGG